MNKASLTSSTSSFDGAELGFLVRGPKGPFITEDSVESIVFSAQSNGTKQSHAGVRALKNGAEDLLCKHNTRAEFLNLGATDILFQIILCWGVGGEEAVLSVMGCLATSLAFTRCVQ